MCLCVYAHTGRDCTYYREVDEVNGDEDLRSDGQNKHCVGDLCLLEVCGCSRTCSRNMHVLMSHARDARPQLQLYNPSPFLCQAVTKCGVLHMYMCVYVCVCVQPVDADFFTRSAPYLGHPVR